MSTSNPFQLKGEVAIVTGGGTGLGFGIARELMLAGARVLIVGRREGPLQEAVQDLGADSSYLAIDVTLAGAPEAIVNAAIERYGSVSIVVNNAGVHLKKAFEDTGPEEFHEVMRTHLDAGFLLAQAAVGPMRARGHGHILFIASMTTFIGMPKLVAYSAAKAAQGGVVRCLATELGPDGIRVNAIAPGWIASDMLKKSFHADPERERKVLGRIPTGAVGRPEDIGRAAVFLSSPAASYINGVVLPVDGGALVSL